MPKFLPTPLRDNISLSHFHAPYCWCVKCQPPKKLEVVKRVDDESEISKFLRMFSENKYNRR